MLRRLHNVPGLLAAVVLVVMALSGAALSVFPAIEALQAPPTAPALTVAELAQHVATQVPGVTRLARQPSGLVVADYSTDAASGSVRINPRTGAVLGPYRPSALMTWLIGLHRSLLLQRTGRMIAGAAAAAMVLLCLSGAGLMARRMGGWRRIFGRTRGTLSQRLHVQIGRAVIFGLMLSALTGVWITLANFQIVPNGLDATAPFPQAVNGGTPAPVGTLAALKAVPVDQLRELLFPTDPSDVFTLTTSAGQGYVDQANGHLLSWLPNGPMRRIYETVYMLHTGQGLWQLGLILGLSALGAPVLAGTGTLLWWRRRRALPRLRHNHGARTADTVILVGSEGNATWGFARTLHDALTAQGLRCHTAAMNSLRGYPQAQQMFILAATHGDGAAPASASQFMARLARMRHAPDYPVALLGFGDRSFPQFSQFAHDVAEALDDRRWNAMLPYEAIDRQSPQEFARWGRAVGESLGLTLELNHQPQRPRTRRLVLIERIDYGQEVQAPTAILRFAPEGRGRLPRFAAGDLAGILPPGSDLPRFYSLASSVRDGFLEICVKKHPGGACSGFLHSLEPGEVIDCFVKPNPGFRPARGRRPVILIGAGTGVGPLAGFIRGNARGRAMHLYFGGRDPSSDFLYADEMEQWLGERRLTTLTTAFSRIRDRAYVQDRIAQDAHHLRKMIQRGAQVMVCGGRDMAEGVVESLEHVLAPLGLSTHALKAEGRYVEDVY